MLSKIEIISHEYKLQKHMICTGEPPVYPYNSFPFFLLFDSNKRLLACTKNFMAVKSLSDMNLKFSMGFQTKNPTDKDFTIKRTESWKLQLNVEKTKWNENLNIHSYEELNSYILINQKILYLENIFQIIENHRKNDVEVDPIQHHINISKYLEAKEILEKNIQEDIILEYPYTTGYSKFKEVTLQEAAKIIKLQHEFRSGLLAESENLRMKYKKMIAEETNIENLKNHFTSFKNEIDKYCDI